MRKKLLAALQQKQTKIMLLFRSYWEYFPGSVDEKQITSTKFIFINVEKRILLG